MSMSSWPGFDTPGPSKEPNMSQEVPRHENITKKWPRDTKISPKSGPKTEKITRKSIPNSNPKTSKYHQKVVPKINNHEKKRRCSRRCINVSCKSSAACAFVYSDVHIRVTRPRLDDLPGGYRAWTRNRGRACAWTHKRDRVIWFYEFLKTLSKWIMNNLLDMNY